MYSMESLFTIRLQMDLKRKFLEAEDCDVVKVVQMVMDRKYPIVRAKRVNTKFGGTVLLTVEDSRVTS